MGVGLGGSHQPTVPVTPQPQVPPPGASSQAAGKGLLNPRPRSEPAAPAEGGMALALATCPLPRW